MPNETRSNSTARSRARACVIGALVGTATCGVAFQPAFAQSNATGPAPKTTGPSATEAPAKDPEAMRALDAMVKYLRTLPSFSIRAQVERDEVLPSDFKLTRSNQTTVTVQRPNQMRAEVRADDGQQLYVYDGKKLSMLTTPENYYISTPAPTTLRDTLDAAVDRHALELPLIDMLFVAMGGSIKEKVETAGFIGPSTVDGVLCNHVAFRTPMADLQLWVQQGDKPLPRQMVITTRDEPTQPQYQAQMTWDTAPQLTTSLFQFVPPKGALPIAFGNVNEKQAPSGTKQTKQSH